MEYSFGDADAAGRRKTQYFETGGHRAIYHQGWIAATFHGVPWELSGSVGFDSNLWELYNIEEDFSQAHDLAAKHPEKLAELQALFDEEAKKYNIYPLDDRFAERRANPERPSLTTGRKSFTYGPGNVRIPEDGASGVLIAIGGPTGGYTLFLDDGVLVYEYNFFARERYRVAGDAPLRPGARTIVMAYEQTPSDPPNPIAGGQVTLSVDGNQVASGKVEKAVPSIFSATETMDIGGPVSASYPDAAPYSFTGTIRNVTVELK